MILIGIPACARMLGHDVEHRRLEHTTPARYAAAVIGAAGATPVMIPPVGAAALPILDVLHGLLLPGSPSNVHPSHYGAPSQTPDWHDPARDGTTLPLIREALRRGLPLLAICRGIQELNVALGGSLHQRVHELPGREDHRGRGDTADDRYAPAHDVALAGRLATMLGSARLTVNTVHGQAIDRLAPGLAIEATAEDGTIEAVRVEGRPFAMGVQWHPEWNYAADPASLALFAAFGDACRSFAAGHRKAA